MPISAIIVDRYPINRSTLSLVEYLKKGGTVPPIRIAQTQQGQYKILDGRHRITAYKLLGRTEILSKYSERIIYY